MASVTEERFQELTQKVTHLEGQLNLRTGTIEQNVNEVKMTVNAQLPEEVKKAMDTHMTTVVQTIMNQVSGIVAAQLQQIRGELEEAKKDRGKKTETWNIKDPKQRGTTKFAGDKKENVRNFTTWRKSALIYMEKFKPGITAFLNEQARLNEGDDDFVGEDVELVLKKYNFTNEETLSNIQDFVHYFLFEHLTDTAAEVIEGEGEAQVI